MILKKINSIFIAAIILVVFTMPCIAANPTNITITECDDLNRVVTVAGTIATARQNENIILTVLKKDVTEDVFENTSLDKIDTAVVYFMQKKADSDGSFSFSFKFNGENGDYGILLDSKALAGTYVTTLSFTNTLWDELKVLKDDTTDNSLQRFRNFIEAEALPLGVVLTEYNALNDTTKNEVCTMLKAFAEDYTAENFVSEWEKNIIWTFINAKKDDISAIASMVADKYAQGSEFFCQNWMPFFLDNYSPAAQVALYSGILSNPECNSLDKFTQMMRDNLVIAYVQSTEYWKDVYKIIEAENNVLGFNTSALSVFSTLSGKDAVVNALHTQGYNLNTSAEIINLFTNLVSAQKTAESRPVATPKPKPSGSGGGGGSWSVGIPTVTPNPTITPEPASPAEPEPQKPTPSKFSDIENVEWAHEAIEYLSGKGILSGVGEGRFEPNRYMTREELVKMLDNAFNFSKEEAEGNFADADKNAWYYSAVSAAAKKGIVTGYDNNTFGIGKLITREDAAVIFLRASGKENFEAFADISFSDKEAVSDYAKEAVGALNNSGIISGMGDGCFMPKGNLTRAQAAKMFYGLLMYIKE